MSRIEQWQGLVISLAATYRISGVDFDDLIAEGNEGLRRADLKFDPDRGVLFYTYARQWIRGMMLALVRRAKVHAMRETPMSDDAVHEGSVEAGLEEGIDCAARRARLSELMWELDPKDAEVVFMYVCEGFTQREIGQQLGVSRQRVEQRHKRGLAHLRQAAKADRVFCELAADFT